MNKHFHRFIVSLILSWPIGMCILLIFKVMNPMVALPYWLVQSPMILGLVGMTLGFGLIKKSS